MTVFDVKIGSFFSLSFFLPSFFSVFSLLFRFFQIIIKKKKKKRYFFLLENGRKKKKFISLPLIVFFYFKFSNKQLYTQQIIREIQIQTHTHTHSSHTNSNSKKKTDRRTNQIANVERMKKKIIVYSIFFFHCFVLARKRKVLKKKHTHTHTFHHYSLNSITWKKKI